MIGPVLFCGDPHSQFHHINRVATELRASTVVLLGDMQAQRPLDQELQPLLEGGIPVLFIAGNHDTDHESSFVNLWDSKLAHCNIHGKVAVLPDGRRIAGLCGCFAKECGIPSSRPRHGFAIAGITRRQRHGKLAGETASQCATGHRYTPTNLTSSPT